MAYDLEIKKKKNFLYATINGIRSNESIKFATMDICQECVRNHCSNVLIDVRNFKEHISVIDIYTLVSHELPELIAKRIKKVAIVDLEKNDKTNFFENVAVNRIHNVQIFTDVFDAEQWLS